MTTTESILIPAVAFFSLLSTILVFLLDKAISKVKLYKSLFQESERYADELIKSHKAYVIDVLTTLQNSNQEFLAKHDSVTATTK